MSKIVKTILPYFQNLKILVCLFIFFWQSTKSQTRIFEITQPASKRITVQSIKENSFDIVLNSSQPWKTKVTNEQFEILPYGTGNQTFKFTIRAPHLELNDKIDTIYFLGANSLDIETVVVEQKGLGALHNATLSQLMSNIQYDAQLDFVKTYGGLSIDDYYNAIPLKDGDYILCGWSRSTDKYPSIVGVDDWIVTKVDSRGNEKWTKAFGSPDGDISYFSIPTSDGGFASCGMAGNNSNFFNIHLGNDDIWVVKFDRDGNVLWKTHIGGNFDDEVREMVETKDGNILVVGFSKSNTTLFQNSAAGRNNTLIAAMLAKNNGNILWSYSLNGNGNDIGMAVENLRTENFVIGGNILSTNIPSTTNYGNKDIWTGIIDNNGNITNRSSWGGSGDDSLYTIAADPDNNILVVSHSNSTDGTLSGITTHGSHDAYLQYTGDNLNPIRSKCIGGNSDEILPDAKFGNNNEFILMVNSLSTNNEFTDNKGNADIWVKKYDKNWNEKWSYRYGGSGFDIGHNILLTGKGGVMVTGHVQSPGLMAVENTRNIRDAVFFSLSEAYLSVYPKKATIRYNEQDTFRITVLAKDNHYTLTQSAPSDYYSASIQQDLEHPNISTITIVSKNPTDKIIYDYFLVEMPGTKLVDTVRLEIFPGRYLFLDPEILYIPRFANSTGTIELKSSENWQTYFGSNHFFSSDITSGSKDNTLTIKAKQENTSKDYLEDTLYAYSTENSSIKDFSIIRQSYKDYFEFYPDKLSYEPYNNETRVVTIETNLQWSIPISKDFSAKIDSVDKRKFTLSVTTTKDNFSQHIISIDAPFKCSICNDTTLHVQQDFFTIKNNTLLLEQLRFQSNYALPKGTKSEIHNFAGEPIFSIDLSGKKDYSIDVSTLPPDFYFLSIFAPDNTIISSGKILKR